MELRIALFRSSSLVARLIRWQTRSPYAHAALLSPAGVLLEAWHWGGVRRARLCDHPGQRVDLFRVTGLTAAQGAMAWAFAERQLGKAYDWGSVARFVSRRQADREASGRWFCSELVFAAFAKAGVPLLVRIEPWAVAPGHLALSPRLELVGTVDTARGHGAAGLQLKTVRPHHHHPPPATCCREPTLALPSPPARGPAAADLRPDGHYPLPPDGC